MFLNPLFLLPRLFQGRLLKTDPAIAKISHIPVFLFSSLEEDKLERKVKLCKADGYIHKTWKIEEVAETIIKFLKQNSSEDL